MQFCDFCSSVYFTCHIVMIFLLEVKISQITKGIPFLTFFFFLV